jgi:hypothetical protein
LQGANGRNEQEEMASSVIWHCDLIPERGDRPVLPQRRSKCNIWTVGNIRKMITDIGSITMVLMVIEVKRIGMDDR